MKIKVVVRNMWFDDIDYVYEIEIFFFMFFWMKDLFYYELLENLYVYYFVIEKDGYVVGYCGIWIVMDDV